MPGKVDEKAWSRAKKIVKEQYGEEKWPLVQKIYQNIIKNSSSPLSFRYDYGANPVNEIAEKIAFKAASFELESARKKDKPPADWFYTTRDKIMKENPSYTEEQASATVGEIWYNKMRPHIKTKINKSK